MLEVEKVLKRFAEDVVRTAESNLIKGDSEGRSKRATGNLYNSIDYDLDVARKGTSFALGFSMTDYGEFVDKGVSGKKVKYKTPYSFKGKMPPQKPILEWVKKKRIRLRDKETGKFKQGSLDTLAFFIQRSIYNKGIKPSLFFTKAFEQHFKDIPQEIEKAFALDVEDLMDFTRRK